jgi:hypothetical protein
MLMIAIGAVVVAGRVPFSVAAGTGVGGGTVDDVPTYVLPGRCESVRNCV